MSPVALVSPGSPVTPMAPGSPASTAIRRRRTPLRSAIASAVVLVAGSLLAGCGLGGTNGASFVAQKAAVTQIEPADRGEPVSVSGQTLHGTTLDLASYRGADARPVVVNVWGSWCGPCVAEAPTLAQAARSVKATFVGIDIRDYSKANPIAYNRAAGISYPSIYDQGSATLRAFNAYPLISPPTTYVLDDRGRIAAVIAGEIPSVTTLADVVDQVAAGQ